MGEGGLRPRKTKEEMIFPLSFRKKESGAKKTNNPMALCHWIGGPGKANSNPANNKTGVPLSSNLPVKNRANMLFSTYAP